MTEPGIGEILKQLEKNDGAIDRENKTVLVKFEQKPVFERPQSAKPAPTSAGPVRQLALPASLTTQKSSALQTTSSSVQSLEYTKKQSYESNQNVILAEAFQSTIDSQTAALETAIEDAGGGPQESKIADGAGLALLGPFYSAIKEVSALRKDPLFKKISGYFTRSKDKEPNQPSTVIIEETTTFESSKSFAKSETKKESTAVSGQSVDQNPILEKIDEIKEVLEDSQIEDQKRFKLKLRVERRQNRQLLRVTRISGKGGGGGSFGGGAIRGIMRILPKLGAGLTAFGSILTGLAVPFLAVASVIGAVAAIGKDVYDMFSSFFGGGSEEVKGRDIGGVGGGLAGAGIGAAIGTMILPGIGTAIGAGLGGLIGNFLGGEAGEAMEEDPEKKAARTEKAEREEQQRKAQKAKEIADKARKARKNEDGFDYVDSFMKKKPSAAIVDDRKKTLQSEKLIKDNRELVPSKTVTAAKNQRELTIPSNPTIKKKDDIAAQAKVATMQKMAAQAQGSDSKKQLEALIAEFKGLRKDMRKQSDIPKEVQNPMLRETIIQSKNLFK